MANCTWSNGGSTVNINCDQCRFTRSGGCGCESLLSDCNCGCDNCPNSTATFAGTAWTSERCCNNWNTRNGRNRDCDCDCGCGCDNCCG